MPLKRRPRLLGIAAALCGVWAVASADNLDQSKLIDALAQRGMGELLSHLAQTGDFDDPAGGRLIEAGGHRVVMNDPTRPRAERREAFAGARAALRALVDDPKLADHPLRPVWRTDLAQLLLVGGLEGLEGLAASFYESGVPSRDQKAAFERWVPVALSMTLRADDEFQSLASRLTRDPGLRDSLESSLAYYRIFDEYRDQKTAWYFANAAHLAALLPDNNPYFVSLGSAPGQAQTPAAERTRLRQLALRRLEPFLSRDVGSDALLPRVRSLAGRLELALGKPEPALSHFAAVAQTGAWTPDRLAAVISTARARAAQGRADTAAGMLADLATKSAVRNRLDYTLLVADARHRLALDAAGALPASRRDAAQRDAYGVYFELIDDPDLGERAKAVRNLVFDRWAAAVPPGATDTQIAALPPTVRMAVADIGRRRGILLQRKGKKTDGRALLQQAVAAALTLQDRAEVGDALWAAGTYNLAYARYALEPSRLEALLDVVALGTRVARDTPDQTSATPAIDLATRVAEALHRQHGGQPGVDRAYREAAAALYDRGHFANTPPADDRLVYYAYAVFQAAGDYEQAAAVYARQLPGHRNYLEAQAQRLACLAAWFKAAEPGAARQRIAVDLLEAAKAIEPGAAAAAGSDDAHQRTSAARALAYARLGRAEVRADRGDTDAALDALAGFENDFAHQAPLVRRGLERRILLLVEAGRLGPAQAAAGEMMGRFPDAAAGVIDNVLSDLEQRIGTMRAGDPAASKLADAAAAMAKLLADWAAKQRFDAAQMLPYHLVVLRSLRIAGRGEEALAYLRDTGVGEGFANNVDVLFEKAQALASVGDPASLRAATPHLNRILGGLKEPYPAVYWRAWVLRLEINLDLGEGVDQIPRRVEQLRQRHPDLGGPAFKAELERLESAANRVGR